MKSRGSYFALAAFLALAGCKGSGQQAGAPEAQPQQEAKSPVDPATAASISGTVKFTGVKPKAQKISMKAEAFCQTAHTTDVFAEDVVVNANNTLKYVYVYVKSGLSPDLKFPVPTEPAVFDQQGCIYHPHVLAVQTGQTVLVRNSDNVLHNVNVKPTKNQGFNFGQPVQGMETKKSFSTAEVMIPAKCDVHPGMKAWMGVQNHPFAAVTGDDGSFSLNNLPPGEYEIEAWHEKYGTSTQKVTVGAKETKSITFTFKGA